MVQIQKSINEKINMEEQINAMRLFEQRQKVIDQLQNLVAQKNEGQ